IFNPPTAAWWGGFWERLIRSLKDLLKRMLGHGKLDYVQMETCLCEAEAIMNSRPLTHITEDPLDLIPLTPGMFLQDNVGSNFPELDCLDGGGLRKEYTGLMQHRKELRSRFRTEYLGNVLQRSKEKSFPGLKVADIVVAGRYCLN